jgi:hypothetical protein
MKTATTCGFATLRFAPGRPLTAIFPGKAGTSGSTGTSPPPSAPVLVPHVLEDALPG